MKLRQIIGAMLMVILTITGIIISLGTAITSVLSSDGIISSMLKVDYLNKSEQEARKVLGNYMSSEKVDEILENVSVKAQIREIALAFDSDNVLQVANSMKNEMKKAVVESLKEETSNENKESFAQIVSDAYIKSIFPVTEFNMLSGIYKTYGQKIVLALVITAVLICAIYMYLALGKKTYKWAIISLYNIVIINIIIVIVLGVLNGIVIGNARTTSVILNIIETIKINVLIATAIAFVIAIVSNYIAYFRKRKHSK